jgi:putative ABC transport system substrate-binding protein
VIGGDPLRLAGSMGPRAANATGAVFATTGLMDRKLALLGQLVPNLDRVGYLGEDARSFGFEGVLADAIARLSGEFLAAANARGVQPVIVEVGRDRDYDAAFSLLAEGRMGAVVIPHSTVFSIDAEEIAVRAGRHEIPAMFQERGAVVAGGLMSYGARQADAWHQAGLYAGAMLKGAVPAQLPIVQTTGTELVLGRSAARAIAISWPAELLGAADEVIE